MYSPGTALCRRKTPRASGTSCPRAWTLLADEGQDGGGGGGGTERRHPTWRLKERMKTTSVALVMCAEHRHAMLPDVVKAVAVRPQGVLDRPLHQAEPLQDPRGHRQRPRDAVPRAAVARRVPAAAGPDRGGSAQALPEPPAALRGDRVLFHYNGHGVPKPTSNGEPSVLQ